MPSAIFSSDCRIVLELGDKDLGYLPWAQRFPILQQIQQLGGKVDSIVTDETEFVISRPVEKIEEWESSGALQSAIQLQKPIVGIEYLQDCLKAGEKLPFLSSSSSYLIDYSAVIEESQNQFFAGGGGVDHRQQQEGKGNEKDNNKNEWRKKKNKNKNSTRKITTTTMPDDERLMICASKTFQFSEEKQEEEFETEIFLHQHKEREILCLEDLDAFFLCGAFSSSSFSSTSNNEKGATDDNNTAERDNRSSKEEEEEEGKRNVTGYYAIVREHTFQSVEQDKVAKIELHVASPFLPIANQHQHHEKKNSSSSPRSSLLYRYRVLSHEDVLSKLISSSSSDDVHREGGKKILKAAAAATKMTGNITVTHFNDSASAEYFYAKLFSRMKAATKKKKLEVLLSTPPTLAEKLGSLVSRRNGSLRFAASSSPMHAGQEEQPAGVVDALIHDLYKDAWKKLTHQQQKQQNSASNSDMKKDKNNVTKSQGIFCQLANAAGGASRLVMSLPDIGKAEAALSILSEEIVRQIQSQEDRAQGTEELRGTGGQEDGGESNSSSAVRLSEKIKAASMEFFQVFPQLIPFFKNNPTTSTSLLSSRNNNNKNEDKDEPPYILDPIILEELDDSLRLLKAMMVSGESGAMNIFQAPPAVQKQVLGCRVTDVDPSLNEYQKWERHVEDLNNSLVLKQQKQQEQEKIEKRQEAEYNFNFNKEDEEEILLKKAEEKKEGYKLCHVYKLFRHDEWERYFQYQTHMMPTTSSPGNSRGDQKDPWNEKYLFHASAPGNFIGILSAGLTVPRVAKLRRDRGMLGRGIYYGSELQTALKYSTPSPSAQQLGRGSRFVLVCQVACGYEFPTQQHMYGLEKAPEGYHCVHGVPGGSAFQEDEYVVYNEGQQRMMYLLELVSLEDEKIPPDVADNPSTTIPQQHSSGNTCVTKNNEKEEVRVEKVFPAAIGIDIGNHTSSIAIWDSFQEKPEVIPDRKNAEWIVPSYVALQRLDEEEKEGPDRDAQKFKVIVGQEAKRLPVFRKFYSTSSSDTSPSLSLSTSSSSSSSSSSSPMIQASTIHDTKQFLNKPDASIVIGRAATEDIHLQQSSSKKQKKGTAINPSKHSSCQIHNVQKSGTSLQPNGRQGEKQIVTMTPSLIQVKLFEEAQRNANAFLCEDHNEKVRSCVVTVPANFNDAQRMEIKDACLAAGMDCLRLINEPTAACISYGVDSFADERLVLVVDIAGTRSTVTIINVDGGIFEIVADGTTPQMGSNTLEEGMMEYVVSSFHKNQSLHGSKHFLNLDENKKKKTTPSSFLLLNSETEKEGTADEDEEEESLPLSHSGAEQQRALARLRLQCERAKIDFCNAGSHCGSSVTIEVDNIFPNVDFSETISRAKFDDLCQNLFSFAITPLISEQLKKANFSASQIQDVILVGGGCKLGKVEQLLRAIFPTASLLNSLDPMTVVAQGAAIQGFILGGGGSKKYNCDTLLENDEDIIVATSVSSSSSSCPKHRDQKTKTLLTEGERRNSKMEMFLSNSSGAFLLDTDDTKKDEEDDDDDNDRDILSTDSEADDGDDEQRTEYLLSPNLLGGTSKSQEEQKQKEDNNAKIGLLSTDMITGKPIAVPLQNTSIQAKIVDLIAEVNVYQEYYNANDQPIEAKYVFPLIAGSAVCGFEAFINAKHVVGVVKEKEVAHQEYREAIEAGHGAYLLDESEESPDVFTVSVGNVPPLTKVIIRITLVTELNVNARKKCVEFILPSSIHPSAGESKDLLEKNKKNNNNSKMPATSVAHSVEGEIQLEVAIEMPFDITGLSCSHAMRIKRSNTRAMLSTQSAQKSNDNKFLSFPKFDPSLDFTLFIEVEQVAMPRIWLEDHPDKKSRAAMITLFRNLSTPTTTATTIAKKSGGETRIKKKKMMMMQKKEILILLDGSCSMQEGYAMQDAKEAAMALLRNLHSVQRSKTEQEQIKDEETTDSSSLSFPVFFNVAFFGTSVGVHYVFPRAVSAAEPRCILKALKAIQKNYDANFGGTNLWSAFSPLMQFYGGSGGGNERTTTAAAIKRKRNLDVFLFSDGLWSAEEKQQLCQCSLFLTGQQPNTSSSGLEEAQQQLAKINDDEEGLEQFRIFTFGVGTVCCQANILQGLPLLQSNGEGGNNHRLATIENGQKTTSGFSEILLHQRKNSAWRGQIQNQIARSMEFALQNVTVDWSTELSERLRAQTNVTVTQAPLILPAIFPGEKLIIYGFVKHQALQCEVSGKSLEWREEENPNEEKEEGGMPSGYFAAHDEKLLVTANGLSFRSGLLIHRLAAKALIRQWTDGILSVQSQENNEKEKMNRKKQLIDVGCEFGLVTPFTSMIAVEKRDQEEQEEILKRKGAAPSTTPSIWEIQENTTAGSSLDILQEQRYDGTLRANTGEILLDEEPRGSYSLMKKYAQEDEEKKEKENKVEKLHGELENFRESFKQLHQQVYKREKLLEEMDRKIRTAHVQLEFAIETFDPDAKKHSDAKKELYSQRAQIEEDLEIFKEKMQISLEGFRPTEEALDKEGITFLHPAEEVEGNNLSRRSKMVEYRAHITKQDEVKIAAEREEIKRTKMNNNNNNAKNFFDSGDFKGEVSAASSTTTTTSRDDEFLSMMKKSASDNPELFRAMQNSYAESGGSVLSTNWNEVVEKDNLKSAAKGMEVPTDWQAMDRLLRKEKKLQELQDRRAAKKKQENEQFGGGGGAVSQDIFSQFFGGGAPRPNERKEDATSEKRKRSTSSIIEDVKQFAAKEPPQPSSSEQYFPKPKTKCCLSIDSTGDDYFSKFDFSAVSTKKVPATATAGVIPSTMELHEGRRSNRSSMEAPRRMPISRPALSQEQQPPPSAAPPRSSFLPSSSGGRYRCSGGGKCKKTEALLLLDVTPLTLRFCPGHATDCIPVIKRNTTIPTKKTISAFPWPLSLDPSHNTNDALEILEGERTKAADNHLLGTISLSDWINVIDGHVFSSIYLDITLDIDANGILHVQVQISPHFLPLLLSAMPQQHQAVDLSKGKSLTITNDKGRLSKEEIEKLVNDAEKFNDHLMSYTAEMNPLSWMDSNTTSSPALKNFAVLTPQQQKAKLREFGMNSFFFSQNKGGGILCASAKLQILNPPLHMTESWLRVLFYGFDALDITHNPSTGFVKSPISFSGFHSDVHLLWMIQKLVFSFPDWKYQLVHNHDNSSSGNVRSTLSAATLVTQDMIHSTFILRSLLVLGVSEYRQLFPELQIAVGGMPSTTVDVKNKERRKPAAYVVWIREREMKASTLLAVLETQLLRCPMGSITAFALQEAAEENGEDVAEEKNDDKKEGKENWSNNNNKTSSHHYHILEFLESLQRCHLLTREPWEEGEEEKDHQPRRDDTTTKNCSSSSCQFLKKFSLLCCCQDKVVNDVEDPSKNSSNYSSSCMLTPFPTAMNLNKLNPTTSSAFSSTEYLDLDMMIQSYNREKKQVEEEEVSSNQKEYTCKMYDDDAKQSWGWEQQGARNLSLNGSGVRLLPDDAEQTVIHPYQLHVRRWMKALGEGDGGGGSIQLDNVDLGNVASSSGPRIEEVD